MRAHILQHVSFEGRGSIEPWLRAHRYEVTRTQFFASDDLPDPGEVEVLIVLGGPMSPTDESKLPWLAGEKWFLRHCIESEKPVLGICLGAQLIVSAMGGQVYKR